MGIRASYLGDALVPAPSKVAFRNIMISALVPIKVFAELLTS